MKKNCFWGGMTGIATITVILLITYTLFYLSPSFVGLIGENTENEAIRIANHLATLLEPDPASPNSPIISTEFLHHLKKSLNDLSILKVRIFSATGKVLYSTDPQDIGITNPGDDFQKFIADGRTFTRMVPKNSPSLEGQLLPADVVETYVPIRQGGQFIGTIEIYNNISRQRQKLHDLLNRVYFTVTLVALTLLLLFLYTSRRLCQSQAQQGETAQQLLCRSKELAERNTELSVLYQVHTAISHTIDLEKLLDTILQTVTNIDIFSVEKKGGIFLTNGARMHLVAHLDHSDKFLNDHKVLKVGECLCGLAAQTGEIVVSSDSTRDCRHTIHHDDMTPHGHVIVPLSTATKLVGVLYLYVPANTEINQRLRQLLLAVGNQIGIALENARLYERSKDLSMHDPLTGLANRRFMQINLDRCLALAARYGRPLAVMMLAVDHFTSCDAHRHDHAADDTLLTSLAALLIHQTRVSDLVVRFGGEEFVIIMPETDLDRARVMAERLRWSIADAGDATVSIGIASYHQGCRSQTLLAEAGKALALARQNGNNRVEISPASLA
ncbi:MAG: sensor domain-containing diguanylate cyclase [Desulfobulbaceae bacterium]|nr:sensor domain-containing diguanylate cyclase [Desulfobulbaceae bacterium]